MTSVRLAHSRFHHGKPVSKYDDFDKVVTSVWTFQPDKSILTYASTVFAKKSNKDHWVKKIHREMAQKRFQENPIRVHIIREEEGPEMSSTPVDWFISRTLIYEFGTHNKVSPDVRRVHHEKVVTNDFNQRNDPFYRPERYLLNGKCRSQQQSQSFSKWLYVMIGFMSYPLISDVLGDTVRHHINL